MAAASSSPDRKRKRTADDDAVDSAIVAEIDVDFDEAAGDSDAGEEEEIQVDFDFAQPTPDDYFAIKRALAHFLSKEAFAAGELADAVCAQPHVGSVVKANDQPIGFATVLNTHSELAAMAQFKAYALSKAHGADRSTLERLFADSARPLGLLLNYRVANAPPQIAPFLHRALFDEIATAATHDSNFAFANYVLLTRTYTQRDAETTGDVPGDEPRGKRQRGDTSARHAFFFEEELLADVATLVVDFAVVDDASAGKLTFDAIVDVSGRLLVVPAAAIERDFLARLEEFMDKSLLAKVEDW